MTSAFRRHMSSCPLHFHMYHTPFYFVFVPKLVVFHSIVNKRVKTDFHKIWACKAIAQRMACNMVFYSSNTKNCTHMHTKLSHRERNKVYWIVTQQMCIALLPSNNEFATQHTIRLDTYGSKKRKRKKRSKMRSVFCSLVKLHSACTSKRTHWC